MTELIFIRHGVTDWNLERRFQGCIDIELNAEGLAQARLTAERLAGMPLAAVYASDLRRARQTAEPIARAIGVSVAVEPGLRERHYGVFEGRTHDELSRDHPEAYQHWRDRVPDYALPGGGESLLTLRERVQAQMDRLAARHPGQTIVAVTHGGVLDSIYRIAAGLAPDAPRRFELNNASINRIGWDGERFHVIDWGDISHLGPLPVSLK
ncbi:MAG: histidine phosphatase family protein [Betaproteobacteria bacterium]|nr:histidine phosphatase family protein [Betaproteobacteria bacterium]